MKIMIVRHAEPDYSIDSLTEKGRVEAELLSRRLCREKDVLGYYVSPLGRARETARYTMEKLGGQAEVLPWLEEFRGTFFDPDRQRIKHCWDLRPRTLHAHPELDGADTWLHSPLFEGSNIPRIWQETTDGVDELLGRYGFRRDGRLWLNDNNHTGTIMLFCHFGIAMAVVAYLTHMSPVSLWQNFCMTPSSVTTLVTEERVKGETVWRCFQLGDITHLLSNDQPWSTAGLFPEVYDGRDTTDPVEWGDRHHP